MQEKSRIVESQKLKEENILRTLPALLNLAMRSDKLRTAKYLSH